MNTNQEPISVWAALPGIVDQPASTFRRLMVAPRWKWVLPLVITVVIGIVASWLVAPYASALAEEATQAQFAQAEMSPEQAEALMAQSAQFRSPTFIALTGAIASLVITPIQWLLGATVLYFVTIVAGSELRFNHTFVMVAWAALPIALQNLVQSLFSMIGDVYPTYPGLSALVATGQQLQDAGNPWIPVLGFVNIFWFWHIFLLIVGLSVIANISRFKAFWVVFIYTALAIGLAVVPTLLTGAFGS